MADTEQLKDKQYIEPNPRPALLKSQTTAIEVPWGTGVTKAYVTLSFDSKGYICEVFATAGKAGSELQGMTEAACRAGSLLLRFGVDPKHLADAWAGIQSGSAPAFAGEGEKYFSVPDAIAKVIRKAME